jgi:hypothetical protein
MSGPSRTTARLDRRALLTTSLATLTAACVTCPPLARAKAPDLPRISDAHCHLFNAADLPIAGFLNFVVIPEYLPHVPEVALALIDSAVTVLKGMACPAADESRGRVHDATPLEFANRLADRIDAEAGPSPVAALDSVEVGDLARSYATLAVLLRRSQPGGGPLALADPGKVDRRHLARIAVMGREAARSDVGVAQALSGHGVLGPASSARSSDDLGAVWDTIKWCYEMVLPRCRHVRDYLATMSEPGQDTDLLVNLLVDYDAWLGDGPSDGSSMQDQLRFWSAYSRSVAGRIDIRTFAGYDPLRHAEERIVGHGGSQYWAHLTSAIEPGPAAEPPLASGFKIYPPMGFKVIGNSGAGPADDRSGALVAARWKARNWKNFGAELDAALDEFFDHCARRRIPVIAHGCHSQEASSNTGAFANPRYWFERAQWAIAKGLPPLRASIAHWTETREFEEYVPRILTMNLRGESDIFFDIAYTREFLGDGGAAFLSKLMDLYAPVEPSGRWLMFGSDWIMLGREPGVQHYTANAVAAMAAVPWWRDRRQLVLHDNLRRFLSRQS